MPTAFPLVLTTISPLSRLDPPAGELDVLLRGWRRSHLARPGRGPAGRRRAARRGPRVSRSPASWTPPTPLMPSMRGLTTSSAYRVSSRTEALPGQARFQNRGRIGVKLLNDRRVGIRGQVRTGRSRLVADVLRGDVDVALQFELHKDLRDPLAGFGLRIDLMPLIVLRVSSSTSVTSVSTTSGAKPPRRSPSR